MVSVLIHNDPPAAERLYATIADARQRSLATMVLYQTYSQTDPERAARYQAIMNANR
jgi:hypothetical protein